MNKKIKLNVRFVACQTISASYIILLLLLHFGVLDFLFFNIYGQKQDDGFFFYPYVIYTIAVLFAFWLEGKKHSKLCSTAFVFAWFSPAIYFNYVYLGFWLNFKPWSHF